MREITINERIIEAFDHEALKRVCEMDEDQFADEYMMKRVEVAQADPAHFYNFLDRGADILAVAHLDTVVAPPQRACSFANTPAGPVVHSGALDDRLGAYIILELLPTLGLEFDILLTVGEECGMSTASFFESERSYNWGIEFDRGGTDVVMYDYEDSDTIAAVELSGAEVGMGSFSDIAYLEQLGVKCFNWGVGYRDYHGPRSHAYLWDTFMMVDHFLTFHDYWKDEHMPHVARPRSRWSDYWTYNPEPVACVFCGVRGSVSEETDVCSECNTCNWCGEQDGDCLCYRGKK